MADRNCRGPSNAGKVSDMLENETRKMEEKLSLVKKMMEMEREKRSIVQQSNQGTLWRGATTKTGIKGYSSRVLDHHRKAQPNLPPTSMVTEGVQNKKKKPISMTNRQTQESKAFVGSLSAEPVVN